MKTTKKQGNTQFYYLVLSYKLWLSITGQSENDNHNFNNHFSTVLITTTKDYKLINKDLF